MKKKLSKKEIEVLKIIEREIDPFWIAENMPPSSYVKSDEEWYNMLNEQCNRASVIPLRKVS